MKGFAKVLMVLGVFVMAACESDEFMDKYSEWGAEYDKDVLKSSTDELESEFYKLSQTDFAKLSHSMNARLNENVVEGNVHFVKAVVNVGDLMYYNDSQKCYFEQLIRLTFDKDYYCSVLYEEGCGEWQWDGPANAFVKVRDHNSDVIFKFPAGDDLAGDTAVLTITDLAFYAGKFPDKGNLLEDGTTIEQALEKLRFSVKVGDELLLTSNVNAAFTDDGFFKDVAMTFNPQPYNISGELGKDDVQGYWTLTFNKDATQVMGYNLGLEFDEGDQQTPVRSLHNSLTVGEVVIQTNAKTGKLYNDLLSIEKLEFGSEAYAVAFANALNTYASMDVRYLIDNRIIAKVGAVAKVSNQNPSDWWVDLEFEFSDGSRVSGEEYYKDYLVEFKMGLEQLIGEFSSKFGV